MQKILLAIFLITLAGCSTINNIPPSVFPWSERVCSNNEGLSYVDIDDLRGVGGTRELEIKATCINGGVFKKVFKEEK